MSRDDELSQDQQDQIVAERAERVETISEEAREELYNQLDDEHKMEADDDLAGFADNAMKAYRRGHPLLLGPPPSPFGHEFCGVDTSTGRRVVAANSAPCGACPACRRGQETLCEHLFPLLNGSYAEFILVPERIARTNLLQVPSGMPSEVAAMVEPLACCLHGVEAAGIRAGDTVAVIGLGPIGLMSESDVERVIDTVHLVLQG